MSLKFRLGQGWSCQLGLLILSHQLNLVTSFKLLFRCLVWASGQAISTHFLFAITCHCGAWLLVCLVGWKLQPCSMTLHTALCDAGRLLFQRLPLIKLAPTLASTAALLLTLKCSRNPLALPGVSNPCNHPSLVLIQFPELWRCHWYLRSSAATTLRPFPGGAEDCNTCCACALCPFPGQAPLVHTHAGTTLAVHRSPCCHSTCSRNCLTWGLGFEKV